MNKTSRVVIAISVMVIASLWSQPVQTGSGIQRCETPDGESIYTDRACATFGAKAVPMAGELLVHLVNDDTSSDLSIGGYADASAPLPARASARPSFSGGCARTPAQLSMDLQGAFALGDVNRVAESYYWVGMSHRQATPVMRQLERLAAQPLLDAQFFHAQIGSGDMPLAELESEGFMQLVFAGDGPRAIEVEVQRYSGCYFIRF